MRYIGRLFRVLHFHPALAGAPFTPAELAEIRSGRIPYGNI